MSNFIKDLQIEILSTHLETIKTRIVELEAQFDQTNEINSEAELKANSLVRDFIKNEIARLRLAQQIGREI